MVSLDQVVEDAKRDFDGKNDGRKQDLAAKRFVKAENAWHPHFSLRATCLK